MTHTYDKMVETPNGQKPIPYTIKALAVELKADTIRLPDSAGSDPAASDAAEPLTEEVPK